MDLKCKGVKSGWAGDEELIYSVLCMGIAISLVFWPLLNSLFCMALFAYWLFFTKKTLKPYKARRRWLVLFGSLYAGVVISVVYSANLHEAAVNLQQKSALLLFPLVFASSSALTSKVINRTSRAFTWATCIGSLTCLLFGVYYVFTTGSFHYLRGYDMVLLKDMLPFIMGLCCLLSLIFLVNKIYDDRIMSRPWQLLITDISMSLLLVLFVLLLGNRSILICLCAIAVFYAFNFLTSLSHRLIVLGTLALLSILAVIFNPSLNSQWKDLVDFSQHNEIPLDTDKSLGRAWGGKAIRVSIWKCSWDVIEKNWLVGVGTGDVQDELQKAYEKRKFYFASRYNTYNAHNQFIQETLSQGFIGFLSFAGGIFIPVLVGLKRRSNAPYILFLLCFAFVCITESVLEVNKGIILYSFFNSIFIFKKT